MRMIILAAGQGIRLRPLTDDRPKCLVPLNGKPLLDWQLKAAEEVGIKEVIIVGGYMAELLEGRGYHLMVNEIYDSTNMVHTLFCAKDLFGDEFILSYGDIAYSPSILWKLMSDSSSVGVIVDLGWREYWEMRFDDPLNDAESLQTDGKRQIVSIGQPVKDITQIEAQYIGLMAFRGIGVAALRAAYSVACKSDRKGENPFGQSRSLKNLYMTDLLQGMIDLDYPISAVPVDRQWLEIDSLEDLALAEKLVAKGRLS